MLQSPIFFGRVLHSQASLSAFRNKTSTCTIDV